MRKLGERERGQLNAAASGAFLHARVLRLVQPRERSSGSPSSSSSLHRHASSSTTHALRGRTALNRQPEMGNSAWYPREDAMRARIHTTLQNDISNPAISLSQRHSAADTARRRSLFAGRRNCTNARTARSSRSFLSNPAESASKLTLSRPSSSRLSLSWRIYIYFTIIISGVFFDEALELKSRNIRL